jgi:hypothetical protein
MVTMTNEEADAKAKELYGPKAFAEEDKDFRVCLDTSWSEGKKFYKTARLLGWGETWEDAFALAEKRTTKNPAQLGRTHKPTQLELF